MTDPQTALRRAMTASLNWRIMEAGGTILPAIPLQRRGLWRRVLRFLRWGRA